MNPITMLLPKLISLLASRKFLASVGAIITALAAATGVDSPGGSSIVWDEWKTVLMIIMGWVAVQGADDVAARFRPTAPAASDAPALAGGPRP